MVKTSLVGPDIEFGEAVLSALDAAKFPVTVAFWLQRGDADRWELVISTPRYGEKDAYLQLTLAMEGRVPSDLHYPIRVESNRHPMIRELRKIFGKAASVKGMRLGLHTIGGVFINDGYVYRIK
jgi:hypothetical protein